MLHSQTRTKSNQASEKDHRVKSLHKISWFPFGKVDCEPFILTSQETNILSSLISSDRSFSFLSVSVGEGARDRTQKNLMHTRHVLYHWSTPTTLILFHPVLNFISICAAYNRFPINDCWMRISLKVKDHPRALWTRNMVIALLVNKVQQEHCLINVCA